MSSNDSHRLNTKSNKQGNPPGFKTGAGYFDELEKKLQSKIALHDEIAAEAPLLAAIPKMRVFDVPAGYFDELPTLVSSRVISSGTDWKERLSLLLKPRFVVPVLSMIVIAFAGIRYSDRCNDNTRIAAVNETYSLDDQLMSIDESMLIDQLASYNVDVNTGTELENYLLDTNLDETELDPDL